MTPKPDHSSTPSLEERANDEHRAKEFPSPGQAEAALRTLRQRRGVQLHEAGYDARIARRNDETGARFYLEVFPLHPHRYSKEGEHRVQTLINEYRMFYPKLVVELRPRK